MRWSAHLAIAIAAVLLVLLACSPSLTPPTATRELEAASVPPPTATLESPTSTLEPPPALLSIDDTWSEYINNRLGFSIRVPNTMYYGSGDCVWREDATDHSYRPVMAEVPVAIFEAADRVYITAASYAELTLPTQEPSGAGHRYFFAGCERITNSLERVQAQESTSSIWEIVARPVESEADLEALIDEVYGEACLLGGTSESDVPGVLRVRVQGDGLPPEESACWLNFMYVFLYDPELQRAATWITGQSVYFVANAETYEGYDGEMLESFRFLP